MRPSAPRGQKVPLHCCHEPVTLSDVMCVSTSLSVCCSAMRLYDCVDPEQLVPVSETPAGEYMAFCPGASKDRQGCSSKVGSQA